jgi:hypothetical protein
VYHGKMCLCSSNKRTWRETSNDLIFSYDKVVVEIVKVIFWDQFGSVGHNA